MELSGTKAEKLARILIVEDEGIVALNLKDKLELLGYEVMGIGTSGEEAIVLTGESFPDLVLMDIKLRGEMDGVSAAEQIRKKYSIPVIYLTAFGNQVIMERAKVTEPYGYILKPIHERELHIAIEMALYRHRAETELKESEEKYRLLFDKGPVPLFVLDIGNGKIIAANETALSHYGYTAEEINFLVFDDICPGEGDASERYQGRWVHRKNGGEGIFVEATSHSIRFMDRDAMLLHARDVTEQIKAEQMLKQRQAALQAVYRMATTLGFTFEQHCGHVSETLSKLLDVKQVFVLRFEGREATVLAGSASGSGQEKITFPCQQLFGRELNEGSKVSESDGPFFDMPSADVFRELPGASSAMTVPVVDAASCLLGAITVLGDSGREFGGSDMLIAEVFARYVANEIEREKLSASLASAQKMEVIGKLSGGVAHEVRNPLNAIMAISDALASDLGEDPEYKEFLYHMRLQVERLSTLMNDMLDLGKPVERMYFREDKVSDICSSVMDLWQHSPMNKTCKVEIDMAQEAADAVLVSDSERLQQVFLNLLENAAQHSPEGSVVDFQILPPEDGIIRILVQDSGIGMQEDVDRIFEPFYSTRRGGTGLGLSIVKHFIESHNGTVSACNREHAQGFVVEVRLPVVCAEKERV